MKIILDKAGLCQMKVLKINGDIAIYTVVGIVLLVGGFSGVRPIIDILLGALALVLILWAVFLQKKQGNFFQGRVWYYFIFITCFVLFMQLLPVPLFIGNAYFGDQSAVAARLKLSSPDGWAPISLNFISSFYSLCTFLIFAASVTVASNFIKKQFRPFLVTLACVFIVSIFCVIFQITYNETAFNFYKSSHRGVALGFFANRNHYALFIAYCFVFISIFIDSAVKDTKTQKFLFVALAFSCIVVTAATLSRVGLLINLSIIGYFFFRKFRSLYNNSGMKVAVLIAVVMTIVGMFLVIGDGKFGVLLSRFGSTADDERWLIWTTTLKLIGENFPSGIGSGVFSEYYMFKESVENLRPTFVNHAHNEVLEVILELGAVGVLLLFSGLAVLSNTLWKYIKCPRARRVERDLVVLVVIATLVHCLFDYPLRAAAIATLFGVSIGYLNSLVRQARPDSIGHHVAP